MFGIINKLKSAACISDEYHNNLGVKMSINIDRMVKKFKDHETSIKKIAETELIKIYSKIKSSKDVFNGSEVRRVIIEVSRVLKAINDCCRIKQPPETQFKREFTTVFTRKFL